MLTAHESVNSGDVDRARRALDYLCLAQLYLRDNVLLNRALYPSDIVESPTGHWGTCPPVNAVLSALGPYRHHLDGIDVQVVHGGGHAGPSALSHAWLTGSLAHVTDDLDHNPAGLQRLIAGFPHHDRFGGEITPLLPGHCYMGGQLGAALPTAHGMALDMPNRLVIALIGDGECETGATAAAWLGAHALAQRSEHGRVLPVILLNGLRMGGSSLLAGLTLPDLRQFLAGLGYQAIVTRESDTAAIREAVREGLAGLKPLQHGPSTVVAVTIPKGHGAPESVGGRRIMGTPLVHKTPLIRPSQDKEEFGALADWLAGYRPHELFTARGSPTSAIVRALGTSPATSPPQTAPPRNCLAASASVANSVRNRGVEFGSAMAQVLKDLHEAYGLRVFSPDELSSNHIRFGDEIPDWIVEVLNEELCHAWAQGYQETGRRALVVSYEAFAPIVASLLAQHLIYRRLTTTAGRPPMPSIVYLLTSLGWQNTISHANPGLIDMALATRDPSVHVYTPADTARTAAAVTFAVRKLGRCSLVVSSKHPMPAHPLDTIESELRDGYAIWPHIADDDQPDLILLSAGDLPARQLTSAAAAVKTARPETSLRYIHVHDLVCLGAPSIRPDAISDATFTALMPPDVPVLAAVPCHATAVHALFGERGMANRLTVRGWRTPSRPLPPDRLLEHAELDITSLTTTALSLLDQRPPRDRRRATGDHSTTHSFGVSRGI
ncbi:MAG: phosphoketolase [Nocardiopsaceae bacterium]|nr:phosphoketolase [Nocardiopsaceae bacterium]